MNKQRLKIKGKLVENPNWLEADQLAIYINVAEELKSELPFYTTCEWRTWTADLRFKRHDHSAPPLYFSPSQKANNLTRNWFACGYF